MSDPATDFTLIPPPQPPAELQALIVSWRRRQIAKGVAGLLALTGANITDHDGQITAWVLALLAWGWEIFMSWRSHKVRRAEKAQATGGTLP